MPIQLPAISRREFLVAGAAGLLAGRTVADDRKADDDLWFLFSDTHVAGDRKTVHRGVNMAHNLEACVADALRLGARPAGAFVTGDCAFSSGETVDYATVLELLRPVPEAKIPLHLTLGNHDERRRFARAAEDFLPKEQPVVDRKVAVVEGKRANWFLLDSLDKTNKTAGLIGKAQLEWLGKELDARKDKPALVAVHHNPAVDLQGVFGGILDSVPFLAALKDRRQVKALFYGHTHHWDHTPLYGIHLVNLPPTAYLFDRRDPSGWVDCRLTDSGMTLQLHALDRKHAAHGQQLKLEWRSEQKKAA